MIHVALNTYTLLRGILIGEGEFLFASDCREEKLHTWHWVLRIKFEIGQLGIVEGSIMSGAVHVQGCALKCEFGCLPAEAEAMPGLRPRECPAPWPWPAPGG